jgi:hypothetical protein
MSFIRVFLLVALATQPCWATPTLPFQYEAPNDVMEAAQRTITSLETESALNSCFSACYHAIVHDSCKHVDEIGKRRLAYLFAKCHLQFAGRSIPHCPATGTAEAFSQCLSTLDAEGFQTYTLYTTHTDNLYVTLRTFSTLSWLQGLTCAVAGAIIWKVESGRPPPLPS